MALSQTRCRAAAAGGWLPGPPFGSASDGCLSSGGLPQLWTMAWQLTVLRTRLRPCLVCVQARSAQRPHGQSALPAPAWWSGEQAFSRNCAFICILPAALSWVSCPGSVGRHALLPAPHRRRRPRVARPPPCACLRSNAYKTLENIDLSKLGTYQRHEKDSGSSEVQVARLTARIEQISSHLANNKKDYAARRGLEAILSQRKSLLQYVYRADRWGGMRCAKEGGRWVRWRAEAHTPCRQRNGDEPRTTTWCMRAGRVCMQCAGCRRTSWSESAVTCLGMLHACIMTPPLPSVCGLFAGHCTPSSSGISASAALW